MAEKQAKFALFKQQIQQYLDQMEAASVKEALGTFLQTQVSHERNQWAVSSRQQPPSIH
jgi:uncharacterized protein HemY